MADVLRADDFGDGLKSLLIPIRNSEESVEVRLDELPEDPSDILDILKAEVAPLEVWLKFAVCIISCDLKSFLFISALNLINKNRLHIINKEK